MRLLATVTGQTKAEALVAYLLTRQISTHVEATSATDQWEVWIRDEDRMVEARKELDAFLENPNDGKYGDAVRQAQQLLEEQRKKRQENARKIQSGRKVFRDGYQSGSVPPITLIVVILASIVSLFTNFMNPRSSNTVGNVMMEELMFVSPRDYAQQGKDPAASLKKGQLWRVVTPIFPHGDTFHLLFNVMAIIQLGKIVERMEGTGRYAMLLLISAVFSSLLQGLMPERWLGSPFFRRPIGSCLWSLRLSFVQNQSST